MNGLIHRHILLGGPLGRHNVVMIIGMLLCVYFSYHLMSGNRSIVRLIATHVKIEEQTRLHEELVLERARLEEKVKMMRPGSVDRDLAEERIQEVLGYAAPNDLIIPMQ